MGPFSITGQPNAMGGREVGGLASTLAAHMAFSPEEVDRVRRFWSAPAMATAPGLKAVDMFDAVHDGRIKALWVMATNPAVSLPNVGKVREALSRCPFVVVSDVMADTDTGRYADVRLPALAWGEKDGTVTNSERMISRQRPIFSPPGEARADWWIVSEVACRMGFEDAFNYPRPSSIFFEHARLTAFENADARKLDLREWVGIDYDNLEPKCWGGESPFADGRFSTPSGRARLIAVTQRSLAADADFPIILNNGRYRDQWHTMTRTGLSARLSQHRREPLVEINPADAAELDIAEGDFAAVETAQGKSIYRATLAEGQRRGEMFVPIHWTDVTAAGGRTGMLPAGAVDPFSGQPGFKATRSRVARVDPLWRGFLVTQDEAPPPTCLWWTRIRVFGGWLYELAGMGDVLDEVEDLLPDGQRAEAVDPQRGSARVAVLDDEGRLRAALYASRQGPLPPRDWIISQLEAAEPPTPVALLAGRPSSPQPDRGPVVCVCFDLGMKTILTAITDRRLMTVAEVGSAIGAGTNCGSCRPEIARLIEDAQEPLHAAG
jgi:assimilatory nitrate reductase catalytic subunit